MNRFARSVLVVFALSSVTSVFAGYVNSMGQQFVEIPPGQFIMGTSDLDEARMDNPEPDKAQVEDESPAHIVRFTKPFYVARTEVTQGQWFDLIGTRPGPAEYWARKEWRDLPVVSVNWGDTQRFIEALNEKEHAEGVRYRLPTEAEWEYVARAGNSDLRPFDDSEMDQHIWFIENSGDVPQPVGTRQANPWGIHDLFGNVWEWTDDWYSPTTYGEAAPRIDPAGPAQGRLLVRRGGSYHCPRHMLRPGYRAAGSPSDRFSVFGFRLVMEKTGN